MKMNKMTFGQKFKIGFFKYYKEVLIWLSAAFVCIILIAIATRGFNTASKGLSLKSQPYRDYAFKLGSLTVKWYAVFILTGIIFAAVMAFYEIKKLGIDKDKVSTGLLVIIPIAILTSRLYYVAFDPDKSGYNSFRAVIDITKGGLSIHGAFIGAVLSAILFKKWLKYDLFKILDLIVIGFLIGQIFGRWGNFFNQEAHGGLISEVGGYVPKGIAPFIWHQMKFENGIAQPSWFHPTFLYEIFFNFLLLISFLIYRRMRVLKVGDMFCIYLFYYSLMRGFIIEPLRTDQLMVGGVAVNTWPQFIVYFTISLSVYVIRRIIAKKKNKVIPYYFDEAVHDLASNDGVNTVLFDLDGTLLDTEKIIRHCYKKVFSQNFNKDDLTEDEYISFLGPTLNETFGKYTTDLDLIDKSISDYRLEMSKVHNKEMVKSFKFAKAVVYILKAKGYKLGIVSSKKDSIVVDGLKLMGVYELFDIVVSQDTTKLKKPNPDPINYAIKNLNIKKENAIFIGDNATDIKAANSAKIRSVAVAYSKNIDKAILENPTNVCFNLLEVASIVEGINYDIR